MQRNPILAGAEAADHPVPIASQPAQRPLRWIPIAILAVILAIAGAAGMVYWAANAGASAAWLRSVAVLATVEQAQAAEKIMAVGAHGLQNCLDAL